MSAGAFDAVAEGSRELYQRTLAERQAFGGQANTLPAPPKPRLELAGNRLEHLCEQLENVLGGCHVNLDRIAGQQQTSRSANGIEKVPSPPAGSALARLEQSLDRLAALSQHLGSGLLERLAAL